MLARSKQL